MRTTSAPGICNAPPGRGKAGRCGAGRAAGFTLLELLVIVLIVAVLLGLAMPGTGDGRYRRLEDAADKMSMVINLARQESVLSSRVWMLEIDPAASVYRFLQQRGGELEQVVRRPFAETPIAADGAVSRLEINGQPVAETGRVRFFPTGEQDALRLTLHSGDLRRVLVMDAAGPAAAHAPQPP